MVAMNDSIRRAILLDIGGGLDGYIDDMAPLVSISAARTATVHDTSVIRMSVVTSNVWQFRKHILRKCKCLGIWSIQREGCIRCS